MSPRVYGLPETVLRYEKPDYLKLTAYVRSYNITDSVPASFADGLCDFYIPVGRGRMRRKVRAERNLINYAHPCKALSPSGLASALPRLRKPSLLKRLLHGGDTIDIIGRNIRSSGDFGAVIGVRSDTLNNTLEVYSDSLFTSDGPSGSLFGIRVRITYYAEGEMYSTAEGRLNYRNLLKAYNRSRIYVRTHGKHGPESMCDMFEEIYIVGVDYVRKEDLKSKNESKKRVQMKVPENIPPLSEPLQRAVEKMKG